MVLHSSWPLRCAQLVKRAAASRQKEDVVFRGDELRIILNDRLDAPNTEATHEAIQGDLNALSRQLYNGAEVAVARRTDAKQRFTLDLRAEGDWPIETLLKKPMAEK